MLSTVVQLVKSSVRGWRDAGQETIWAVRECLRPLSRLTVNSRNRHTLASNRELMRALVTVLKRWDAVGDMPREARVEEASLAVLLITRLLNVKDEKEASPLSRDVAEEVGHADASSFSMCSLTASSAAKKRSLNCATSTLSREDTGDMLHALVEEAEEMALSTPSLREDTLASSQTLVERPDEAAPSDSLQSSLSESYSNHDATPSAPGASISMQNPTGAQADVCASSPAARTVQCKGKLGGWRARSGNVLDASSLLRKARAGHLLLRISLRKFLAQSALSLREYLSQSALALTIVCSAALV